MVLIQFGAARRLTFTIIKHQTWLNSLSSSVPKRHLPNDLPLINNLPCRIIVQPVSEECGNGVFHPVAASILLRRIIDPTASLLARPRGHRFRLRPQLSAPLSKTRAV